MIDSFFIIAYSLLSVLGGAGMAIAFVEKGKEWPIRYFIIQLRRLLNKINTKAHRVGKCTVCFSFWVTGVVELLFNIILFINFNKIIFLWPVTGFITLGFVWLIMQLLESLDMLSNAIAIRNEN